MDAHLAPMAVFAVLLPWSVYRRIRRNIGRQPLAPTRLKLRGGFVFAILALIAWTPVMSLDWMGILALLLGTLAGFGISVFALRHTKFETLDGAHFYVPNAIIGLALSGLLMARLAWRMVQLWPVLSQPDASPPYSFGAMSPLTLAMVGAVLAYYGAYYMGILRHWDNPARGPIVPVSEA